MEHGHAAPGLVLFHYTDDISHTSNVNNTYYQDKRENTKIWNLNLGNGKWYRNIGICWKKNTYVHLQKRIYYYGCAV